MGEKYYTVMPGTKTQPVEHRCGHIVPVLVWEDEGKRKAQLDKLSRTFCEDCVQMPVLHAGAEKK